MAKGHDLSGKTAMVTGGAGGIGLEFAKELARRGAATVILDIDEKRLSQASEIITGEFLNSQKGSGEDIESKTPTVYTLRIDLTSDTLIEEIERFCQERGLNPEILINNAGIFSFTPITDTALKKIETFIGLHIRAVTLLSRWFSGRRRQKGEGWLLNMSSMSCWMPMPGLAMYASTKSYIRVFTRSLHYEMKDSGVGVTVACPGGISTDLFGLPEKWKRFAVAIGVLQTPSKFATKALDKMLAGKKQYINGWLNRFSIFFVGIMPTKVRMMVKHRLLDKGITR